MIADIAFGRPVGRIRTLRFARRSSVPLGTACGVAERLRAALHDVLGDACALVIGEPVAIGRAAWDVIARDARLFLTRADPSDVVLVVPHRDARRLVLHAFGEPAGADDAAWSALERRALETIATRCAAAFDPLCAQREQGARPVRAADLPGCAAYFDVRVRRPISFAMGVGIVRDLPAPPPAAAATVDVLGAVPLEVRAVLGEGRIAASELAALVPGRIVTLDTKVGDAVFLNVAGNHVASGIPGVVALRNAVSVRDVPGAHQR